MNSVRPQASFGKTVVFGFVRVVFVSVFVCSGVLLWCSTIGQAQSHPAPKANSNEKAEFDPTQEGEDSPASPGTDGEATTAEEGEGELAPPERPGAGDEEEFKPTPTPAPTPDDAERAERASKQLVSELQNLSHESLIEELLRRLASPEERTRLESGILLRKKAKLSDVELLVKVLKRGNNRDKQIAIIETLGGLQDRRAGEALRFEVEHGDAETRRCAVRALGELNFNWPIPVLVRTLRKVSEDEELRKRAASALGQIGTTQAVYALRTSLASLEETPGAKNAAFWALEKARGEIDDELVDTKMPKGRRLQLYYKGTRYYFYHPANRRGASTTKVGLSPWLLVCVHDSDLRAEELFNICWRAAKKRQMAALVPVVDNMRFPDYGTFNIRGQRFDKRVLELVEHVGKYAGLTVREFYLFGYGAGGDFAHRFAMTNPRRIAKLAFEANTYTAPDPEMIFPRGIARSPLAPDLAIDMYQYLKTDQMQIIRKNSETMREGKEFFSAMTHYGDINGIRSRVSIRTVDVKFEIWSEAEKFLFTFD